MNRVTRLLAVSLILAAPLHSQPAPPVPAPTTAPAEAAPVADPAAPAAVPLAAPPVIKERQVYIPFEDLAATLANEGQGVFLPYREFLEMWNQLHMEKAREAAKSPADAVLSSVECTGQVSGDAATLNTVVKVESFKEDGWAVINLGPTAGISFSKADTGEAVLNTLDGNYQLLLPKKGKYELKLEMMARVERNSGRNQLVLRLPKAPVSRATLTVAEQGWDFELLPGAAFTTQPNGDATDLSFFFGEHDALTISWQKSGGESKLTPLIFAEIQQDVLAASGSQQNTLNVDYRILRAGVDKLTLHVPKNQEILSVSGENIKEWNVTAGEGEAPQTLLVTLHGAARETYRLTVGLESAIQALPVEIAIPQITAVDALRQRGTLTISGGPELDATLTNLSGLSQQEIDTPAAEQQAQQPVQQGAPPPAIPASTVLGKFRYLQLPFTASLTLKRAEPVLEITSVTKAQIELDTYSYFARITAKVTRSGIFDLRVGLPADIADPEATGAMVERFTLTEENGQRWMDIRLKNRASGAFDIFLTGRRVRENSAQDITLPVFSFPTAASHEGMLGVFINTSLDQSTKEPGGLRKVDAAEIDTSVCQLPPAAGQTPPANQGSGQPDLAFRYRAGAAPAVLAFTLKSPLVTADSLVFVELKEQAVRYEWTLLYDISYSGVDTFLINLPKSIAANLRVETKAVKETEKNFAATPPAAEDREIWKITLRDKQVGTVTLELSLEVPFKEFTLGKPIEIDLPELILLDVFQEVGQIAVAKEGNLEVAKTDSSALETIDPSELRPPLAREGIVLAFKPLSHPHALKLSASKNAFLEVPQAVVTTAVINTVVSTDGASSAEAIYWIKNNALQYFSIDLPKGARMLSDVFVNGQGMQPMRRPDQTGLLVKLPSNQQGVEFPVRFLYEIPAPESSKNMGMSGSFSIEPPTIQGASILRSQLTLYLPRDFVYLDFQGSMRLSQRSNEWRDPHRRLRWLIPAVGPDLADTNIIPWQAAPTLPPQSAGGFNLQLPQDGQTFFLTSLDAPKPAIISFRSKSFDMAVRYLALLGVFILATLFIRRSLEAKAMFFAVLGFGALAARGLMNAAWAPFWECVWLGSLAGLALWFLAGFFKMVRCARPRPAPPAGGSTNFPPRPLPAGPSSGPAAGPEIFRESAPRIVVDEPAENLSDLPAFPEPLPGPDAPTADSAASTDAVSPFPAADPSNDRHA